VLERGRSGDIHDQGVVDGDAEFVGQEKGTKWTRSMLWRPLPELILRNSEIKLAGNSARWECNVRAPAGQRLGDWTESLGGSDVGAALDVLRG
jgi:hypothetical protein